MLCMWNRQHIERLNQVVSNIFTAQNAEQFIIRILNTKEEKEQALCVIMKLLRNYPIVRALDFDQVSEDFLEKWIKIYLDQDISLGCFTWHGNILVSVDCLYVRNNRDEFPTRTELNECGVPFRKFIDYVRLIEVAIHNRKKCNFLTSFGVFTPCDNMDIGIPGEMIRMRTKVAEALRIEVFGAAFIGAKMQEAAKKCRYKDRRTFRGLEDMAKCDLDFKLPVNVYPIKIMAIERRYPRLDDIAQ